jgi:16S rRNA (guanine966-N2)-methyltransferase
MVERSERVAGLLWANTRTLGASQVRVYMADALRWLTGSARTFDIIFLDPPFDQNLLGPSCALLGAGGWLAPAAHIYLETPADRALPALPTGWRLLHDKKAGQVRYALACFHDEDALLEGAASAILREPTA